VIAWPRHLALLAAVIIGATSAGAQDRSVRFEIASVGDTTVTIRLGRAKWIRPGARGVAVDPAQRDELVARFRVLRVTGSEAVALVTGQTMPLSTDHMAVFSEPRRRFYGVRAFWLGLLGGALIGFGVGKI
jgi:hypothetical protein